MSMTLLYLFLCLKIDVNLLGESRRNIGFCSRNFYMHSLQICCTLFRKCFFFISFIFVLLVQRYIVIQSSSLGFEGYVGIYYAMI